MKLLVNVLVALAAGAPFVSCTSGTSTTPLPATLPPTACATNAGDAARTVKVTVDDTQGSSGGLFAQRPPELTHGTVRLSVSTAAGNLEPSTISVTRDGDVVATVRGVAPGAECAIDIDLSAGHYVVHDVARTIAFDVVG